MIRRLQIEEIEEFVRRTGIAVPPYPPLGYLDEDLLRKRWLQQDLITGSSFRKYQDDVIKLLGADERSLTIRSYAFAKKVTEILKNSYEWAEGNPFHALSLIHVAFRKWNLPESQLPTGQRPIPCPNCGGDCMGRRDQRCVGDPTDIADRWDGQ